MVFLVMSRELTDTGLGPGRTGGIICFSVEPKTHNIFVLLGRETCFEQMDSSAGRWCDFGGKINHTESVQCGAAREFAEESLCLVELPVTKNRPYSKYMHQVERMLQEKDYFMKLSARAKDFDRVYYLKEVPWQPEIEQKFKEIRDKLLSASRNPGTLPFSLRHHPAVRDLSVDRHFLEKQSIAWWSLDRLAEVVKNQGKFKRQKFRRVFLPVLTQIVQHLQQFYC